MAARARGSRKGFSALGGGPMVPLVGMCLSVVALTAAVTLDGEDSPDSPSAAPTGSEAGVVTAASAPTPAALPAANTCALQLQDGPRAMSLTEARTLTQIAAVGWQVKAPEEMIARVLDVAAAKPNQTPSVTDALDLFTREDATVPTAEAVADLRALAEPGALTCVLEVPPVAAEGKNRSGLTPRAEVVRQGVIDAFGRLTMSGYGAKAARNSPEAAGRALNVAIPDVPAPGAGWILAHWLTARGADYKLATVAYGDRVWAPRTGWQTSATGQTVGAGVRAGRVYVAVSPGTAEKSTKDTKAKDRKKDRDRRRS